MKFINLLTVLSLIFLLKVVLANQCDDLKKFLEGKKVEYNQNIKECKVNSDGKIIEL